MEPLYLNHFYFVVDSSTYEAIRKCEYLCNHFASFEERLTQTADGRSWTGLYLYGQSTYFEIFKEGDDWKAGTTGIALAIEIPEDTLKLYQHVNKSVEHPVHHYWTRKSVEDQELDWFHSLWIDYEDPLAKVQVWTMEYSQTFINRVAPDWASQDISRRRHLSPLYDNGKELREVDTLHLSLSEIESLRLRDYFTRIGYTCDTIGECLLIHGSDVKLQITVADTPLGLMAFSGSTNPQAIERELHYVQSSVVISPLDRRFHWCVHR